MSLYEEKERPENALEYFLDRLASKTNLKAEIETMKAEISELQTKVSSKIIIICAKTRAKFIIMLCFTAGFGGDRE